MKSPLAVLNIQRIGWSTLKAHARHERRQIGDLSHTDPERTRRNEVIGLDPCPEAAVRQYLDRRKAKIDKRNERPFTRIVLSASPEYFRPDTPDQAGAYDPARTRAWTRASVSWLRKEFGQDAVHIALHLDESTVHLHAVVVPTYAKKTKRRQTIQVSHHKHPAFAGERSYEGCHDRYSEALKALGIERGECGGEGRQHRTKRQWVADTIRSLRAKSRHIDAALDVIQRAAEQARDQPKVKEIAAHRDAISGTKSTRGRGRERQRTH